MAAGRKKRQCVSAVRSGRGRPRREGEWLQRRRRRLNGPPVAAPGEQSAERCRGPSHRHQPPAVTVTLSSHPVLCGTHHRPRHRLPSYQCQAFVTYHQSHHRCNLCHRPAPAHIRRPVRHGVIVISRRPIRTHRAVPSLHLRPETRLICRPPAHDAPGVIVVVGPDLPVNRRAVVRDCSEALSRRAWEVQKGGWAM